MSPSHQRAAAWCPTCGSTSEDATTGEVADRADRIPDLRQAADHDRHEAEFRMMSA